MASAFLSALRRLWRPLLLLLAVVAPLEGYLHYRWRQMMRGPTSEYLAKLTLGSPGRTRVLISGDSHPNKAFSPVVLPDSIVSVAFGSDGLRDAELKLRTLLARGVKPAYFILEADDHVAAVVRETVNNESLVVLGVAAADYNLVYDRSLSRLKHWTLRHVPLTDVRNRNMLFLALSEQFQRTIGTLHPPMVRPGAGQTWATLPAAGRARIVQNRRTAMLGRTHYELSSVLRGSWVRILQLCRARGIRVVAVRYPLTPEYLAAEVRYYDVRPMRALLRALPPDTLLDYTRLFLQRPECFEDADHLSPLGGRTFTARFLADLRGVMAVLPPAPPPAPLNPG